jgi:hypothetical protein
MNQGLLANGPSENRPSPDPSGTMLRLTVIVVAAQEFSSSCPDKTDVYGLPDI